MCEILSKEMKKYPVKPKVTDRLEHISNYPSLAVTMSSDYTIKENCLLSELELKK